MIEILHQGHKQRYVYCLVMVVEEYLNQNLDVGSCLDILESMWAGKHRNGQRSLEAKQEFLFWTSLFEMKDPRLTEVIKTLFLKFNIKPEEAYKEFFYIYTPTNNSQIPTQAVSLLELAALTGQPIELLTFLIFRGLSSKQGYPIREREGAFTSLPLSDVKLPPGEQRDLMDSCRRLFNSIEDRKDRDFCWSNSLARAYSTAVGKRFVNDCLLRMADELVALSDVADDDSSNHSDAGTEVTIVSEETLSQKGTLLTPLSKASPLKSNLIIFPVLVHRLKQHIDGSILEDKEIQLASLFDSINPIIQINVDTLPEEYQSEAFRKSLMKCKKLYCKYHPTIWEIGSARQSFLERAKQQIKRVHEYTEDALSSDDHELRNLLQLGSLSTLGFFKLSLSISAPRSNWRHARVIDLEEGMSSSAHNLQDSNPSSLRRFGTI